MSAHAQAIVVKPTGYRITSREGYTPYPVSTWTFEGSMNGTTWTVLDTVTGESTTNWVARSITTGNYYRYFRWFFPDVRPYVDINEVEVFGCYTWPTDPGA